MTEQPEGTSPYDPEQDPDAQQESLNPRTGGQARSSEPHEGDPDADPDNLNPRATIDDEH